MVGVKKVKDVISRIWMGCEVGSVLDGGNKVNKIRLINTLGGLMVSLQSTRSDIDEREDKNN